MLSSPVHTNHMPTGRLRTAARTILSLAIVSLFIGENVVAAPRGHLLIIGGGRRGAEIMNRFVQLAGGPEKAHILILPMASRDLDTSGIEMVEEFRSMGVRHAEYLVLNHEQAMNPASTRKMEGVTGVYFTGGDQSRLTAALKGTPVETALKDLYANGAVIGGTSAGAAVMSEIMITGDERQNKDTVNAFVFIRKDNIITRPGFGFVTGAIIDQHFVKRKRQNRLISLVLEHPTLLGVGIDEATAIVVNPDDTFEVLGAATVIVYDATHATEIRTDKKGNLSAAGMIMHILANGDRFDLASRSPIPGRDNR
jgi:cyanophycinase